jgi:LacI family transcriptional regulator
MGNVPKVALLVETSRSFGRDFLMGVSRYARSRGPWTFHITPGDFEQAVPRMKQWGGTGIIARIPSQRIAKAILEANVPTIALGLTEEQRLPENPLSRLSNVSSDPQQVAEMAVRHLLGRRLSNFAYVGVEDRAWSRRRGEAFVQELRALGHDAIVYPAPKKNSWRQWEREQRFMADWLRSQPLPLGLFACNDDRGRQVLEVCRQCGLNVPEDVAVLGVDNDAVFCDLADPPLSSIALNAETAGYRAAQQLDEMMRGKSRETCRIAVEALEVVTRRSTDIVAIDDLEVVAALQIIRRDHGRTLSVADVATEVAVSRRYLERRFRTLVGRSILEEIQRVRLEYAKRLLIETAHPIATVADMSGFGSSAYFSQFFQKRVGTTPRRFRTQLTT